jgi:hypothetical protein
VLVLTLVIGLLSYASLVTWDSLLVDRLRTREKLRSALLATDSDLKRALDLPATMPDQNPLEYEAWSSFAALVRRAGLFGGAKTLIGLGNSIEVGILAMIFISPQLFAGPLSAPILIGGITGFLASLALHVGYARLRYYFAQPKA